MKETNKNSICPFLLILLYLPGLAPSQSQGTRQFSGDKKTGTCLPLPFSCRRSHGVFLLHWFLIPFLSLAILWVVGRLRFEARLVAKANSLILLGHALGQSRLFKTLSLEWITAWSATSTFLNLIWLFQLISEFYNFSYYSCTVSMLFYLGMVVLNVPIPAEKLYCTCDAGFCFKYKCND